LFSLSKLLNYAITKLQIKQSGRIHGKYKEANQGRTQEIKTHRPQESEGGKAAEAPGICSWLKEAQSEEDGARRGQAVRTALA
jgi:hypothetical protein